MITRRDTIAGGLAAIALPAIARAARADMLVAGTYANEGGKGLYRLTSAGEAWTVGEAVGSITDASFGVTSPRLGSYFVLREGDRGSLVVYDRDYRPLATRSTLGSGPCHVALSADQSAVAVANYSSGNVALWRLDKTTGLPNGEAQTVQHEGRGPNADRQAGPHAHWVGFTKDGRWLHSVDLGADAIFAHAFAAGTLGTTKIAYRAPAGSGPRHLARHPRLPVAYLVSELANTLTVLAANDDGTFRATATLPTLPAGFTAASQAAHIAVNAAGTRLYVSNRGHDSIAVFALAPNGDARLIQHVASGGHWPRFFLLLEDRREMMVANERSGTVIVFTVDGEGRLAPKPGSLTVPGVVFLARRP